MQYSLMESPWDLRYNEMNFNHAFKKGRERLTDIVAEKLKLLPDSPGVYIMKDASGRIIYVGKAVVLNNRVRQYFQHNKNQSP